MTPDKIYIPIIEDDKGGHPCTDWEDFPYPYAQNNIEYIRKDALMEWADKFRNTCLPGKTIIAYLLDKLNQL